MKKISVNTMCFIFAAAVAVVAPCISAMAANPSTGTSSSLKSTGNVVYVDSNKNSTVQFAKDDLEYLVSRIENELAPICR